MPDIRPPVKGELKSPSVAGILLVIQQIVAWLEGSIGEAESYTKGTRDDEESRSF